MRNVYEKNIINHKDLNEQKQTKDFINKYKNTFQTKFIGKLSFVINISHYYGKNNL